MSRNSSRVALLLVAFLAGGVRATGDDADHLRMNSVYADLRSDAPIPTDGTPSAREGIHVPAPRFADGETPEERSRSLEATFGSEEARERYFRSSVVAPQVVRLDKSLLDSDQTTLRRVDFWFVARGDLSKLEDDSFTERLMTEAQQEQGDEDANDADQTGDARRLSDEELAAAGITLAPPAADRTFREHFARSSLRLFKKLELDLTMHVVTTRTAESLLSAMIVDSRFPDATPLANTWRRLGRDEAGNLQPVATGPYRGAGGYLKMLQLSDPPHVILVEGHLVFLEPHAWFDGANLIASKMPTITQMSARRLRRTLLRTLPERTAENPATETP